MQLCERLVEISCKNFVQQVLIFIDLTEKKPAGSLNGSEEDDSEVDAEEKSTEGKAAAEKALEDKKRSREERRKKLEAKVTKAAKEDQMVHDGKRLCLATNLFWSVKLILVDEEVPASEKLAARLQRYRSTTTLSRDADILRRFFKLKVAYKPVMPLIPEPAVEFSLIPEVLKGFKALDELFYKDVEAYMKATVVEQPAIQQSVLSKGFNEHLKAGFEALDREFYQIVKVSVS